MVTEKNDVIEGPEDSVSSENLSPPSSTKIGDLSRLESILIKIEEAKDEFESFKDGIHERYPGKLGPKDTKNLKTLNYSLHECIAYIKYFIDKTKLFCVETEEIFKVDLKEECLEAEVEQKSDQFDSNIADSIVCEGNDSLANLNFCDSVEENNDITENISTSEDQETEKILTVYPKVDISWSLSKEQTVESENTAPSKCLESSKGRLVECEICLKKFNEHYLKSHIETIHEGKRKWVKCEVCAKNLLKNTLKKHMEKHMEAVFQCDKCEKKFTTEKRLAKHTKFVHENYRPFKCSICGKGFTINGKLKTHSVVHTGEKLFTCNICGHSFKQVAHMRTHIKAIHQGIKQKKWKRPHFMCKTCGKVLTGRQSLEKHEEIHLPDRKMINCPLCDKNFVELYFKKHMRVIHNMEK